MGIERGRAAAADVPCLIRISSSLLRCRRVRHIGPTPLLFADVAADQRRDVHARSLEEIGDLEGYIDRTTTILVYCSKGYFQSRNCMRELISATIKQKPIIALIDPETSHGGLSVEEVRSQLLEAENNFCLLYTSPSPRDVEESRMPSSA